MSALILRGGTVVDSLGGREGEFDVAITNGKVTQVARNLPGADQARELDVSGQWITPGLIDLRTHLREPGEEYKEDLASGLAAAAAGGFTTVCAMPGTRPINDSRAVTDLIVARALELGGPRVVPFGSITLGMEGHALTEMAELRDAGVLGVTDDRRPVTDAGLLRRAMEYADTFGLVVMQHCEDPNLSRGGQMHEGVVSTRLGLPGSPREAEDAAVARDLRVAELTGARLHIAHVSSRGAVGLIRAAKARGVRVTADVTPHHLSYTDEAVLGFETHAKVRPPLRDASDREALRHGVEDGTLDCIATDHAPHVALDKDCEFAAAKEGMCGLETALPLLCALIGEGVLSRSRVVAALTAGPAAVLGRSAALEGSGDLTVIDPQFGWTVSAETLRSKSSNTLLLGADVVGAASLTMVGGKVVYERARA